MSTKLIKLFLPILIISLVIGLGRYLPQSINLGVMKLNNFYYKAKCELKTSQITSKEAIIKTQISNKNLSVESEFINGAGNFDLVTFKIKENRIIINLKDGDNIASKMPVQYKLICNINDLENGQYQVEIVNNNFEPKVISTSQVEIF